MSARIREVYGAEFERSTGDAYARFQRSQEKFAAVVATDCFLSPGYYAEELPEARRALHDCWLGFVNGKPQTINERAVGRYLDAIIRAAVDAEAAHDAELAVQS